MKNNNYYSLSSVLTGGKISNWFLLIPLAMVAIFIGKYHIVTDLPEKIIERPYFGFTDIITDSQACIGSPYIVAMANHPSLCRALQNAGYIENEDQRTQRIQYEMDQLFNR